MNNYYDTKTILTSVFGLQYKNSWRDEIANVNFFYDDTLHALQNIVRCWIFNTTQAAGRLGSGAASGRGGVVLLCAASATPLSDVSK